LAEQDYADFTFDDIRPIAVQLSNVGAEAGTGLTYSDYYNEVKSIYEQKESAKKKYKNQQSTHIYAQYGLPDPTIVYGVMDSEDGKVKAYPGMAKWVTDRANQYEASLIKQGVSAQEAERAGLVYYETLKSSVDAKLAQSGNTPFVAAVAKRASIYNKKKK